MKPSPHIQRVHDAAVRQGNPAYIDPSTGLMVMTSAYLRERGACCHSRCRHCPYEETVARAPEPPATRGPIE
ncbi:MAG: DUF5522 domain-containing protein [Myxococcota bacterium]|nr:DUF5522 domain-containing protein [Myxococcota bacterium]MEC9389812.1 DUF5522 domain-containing protein [Myxococcota bacterium]